MSNNSLQVLVQPYPNPDHLPPKNSVYQFFGRLTSPAFSDNFSVMLKFSNFHTSPEYSAIGNDPQTFKSPNLSFGLSWEPGYGVRIVRFESYSAPGVAHEEFRVMYSKGYTPLGPGPVLNEVKISVPASSDSGIMGLVRNGSIVQAWATAGPQGQWMELWEFDLSNYGVASNAPLTMGVSAQASSKTGTFETQVDWVDKSPVPLPPSLFLLVPGFAGLAVMRRRFKR